MKKHVIFILCCVFALSAGKVMAYTDIGANDVSYSVVLNLGDMTELSEASIDAMITEAFMNIIAPSDSEELICKVKVEGTVSVLGQKLSVSVEVSGPCSEIMQHGTAIANKVLDEVKAALK